MLREDIYVDQRTCDSSIECIKIGVEYVYSHWHLTIKELDLSTLLR